VLDFGLWLESAGWREGDDKHRPIRLSDPLLPWAARVLDRHYRKVMKLGRKLKTGTDEQRHELRIAIKKLRYSMEFMPTAYSEKKVKAFRQDLTRLQDGLGHMNDVALTEARLDHLTAAKDGGASRSELNRACGQVLGWCARSAQDSQTDLWDVWEGLRDKDPFWRDGD
jgi:CHAD domain-containing protein